MFEAGEPILMRTVLRGRVRFALPGITVVDDGESIVIFRPRGTPTKVPASYLLPRHSAEGNAAALEENRSGEWTHHDSEWSGTNVLVVARPGSWWSAWVMWSADWEHLCWYVNAEEPLRRTALGFDFRDLALDLVVSPDLAVTEKDRDEYEARRRHGVIDDTDAAHVEAAMVEARQWVEDRRSPFDGSWTSWRPDPAWETQSVPPGWDALDRLRPIDLPPPEPGPSVTAELRRMRDDERF